MPLQNKVDPFGAIQAQSMRGLFMGNRGGRMHDPQSRTLLPGKTHVTRQWITCLTEFKGRKRSLMGPGYTELFFLDEVVALAAGHRPCAECRRADYKLFCSTIGEGSIKAPDLDKRLHLERTGARTHMNETAGDMPDGVMIALDGMASAKRGSRALPFRFSGYGEPVSWEAVARPDAVVLTPPTSILALRNGYQPVWHHSAGA